MIGRMIDEVARKVTAFATIFLLPTVICGVLLPGSGLNEALRDWSVFFVWGIWSVLCIGVFCFWKWCFVRKATSVTIPLGRVRGAVKGFIVGCFFILILRGVGVNLYWGSQSNGPFATWLPLGCVWLVIVLGLMILGACFPLRQEPRRFWWIHLGLFWMILLCSLLCLNRIVGRGVVKMRSRAACARIVGEELTNQTIPVAATKVFAEKGVAHCKCHQHRQLKWQCHVSEEAVRDFATANGYSLVELNPTAWAYQNDSGLSFHYDRATNLLTGVYDSHLATRP